MYMTMDECEIQEKLKLPNYTYLQLKKSQLFVNPISSWWTLCFCCCFSLSLSLVLFILNLVCVLSLCKNVKNSLDHALEGLIFSTREKSEKLDRIWTYKYIRFFNDTVYQNPTMILHNFFLLLHMCMEIIFAENCNLSLGISVKIVIQFNRMWWWWWWWWW